MCIGLRVRDLCGGGACTHAHETVCTCRWSALSEQVCGYRRIRCVCIWSTAVNSDRRLCVESLLWPQPSALLSGTRLGQKPGSGSSLATRGQQMAGQAHLQAESPLSLEGKVP